MGDHGYKSTYTNLSSQMLGLRQQLTSHNQPMYKFLLILTSALFLGALVSTVSLSGCTVHRVNVQQGNVITPESLEKLKVGMNQRQIKNILGSPLVEDPFRKDRWDYVYRMSIGEIGTVQASHITLFFTGDTLAKVQVNKPPIAENELIKPSLRRSK